MFKNMVDLIGFLGKNAQVKVASDSSTNFTYSASSHASQRVRTSKSKAL